MTIQEFNNWVKENGLDANTEITFTDFSGTGTLDKNNLAVEGTDDHVRWMGRAPSLNIDITA